MAMTPAVCDLVEAIRQDQRSGARALAARAAEALCAAAPAGKEAVADAAKALISAQPAMAPLYNLSQKALAAADVEAACREFLSVMDVHAAAIARHAATLIPAGATVLTHSYSSTVVDALLETRDVKVIATESRPVREGVLLAERLAAAGIPVTLILDAAIAAYAGRCRLALVGADAVTGGAVVNKTGTALVALAAWTENVPLYALCGSEKFLPDSYVPPREPPKDPRQVLERELPGIRVENYYFESTPLEWFAGLVTEDGVKRYEGPLATG
jgi:translation initiation factor eIF-2B subunit delta